MGVLILGPEICDDVALKTVSYLISAVFRDGNAILYGLCGGRLVGIRGGFIGYDSLRILAEYSFHLSI